MKKLLPLLLIFSFSFFTLKAQRPACTFSITVTPYLPISCFGQCNGSYIATAHSGVPPYRWNGGPYTNHATDTVTNLCVGTYTVTATDSIGCTASATVTITQPAQLSVSITTVVPPTCGSCPNGSLTASTTGGTPPYSYSWTPSGGTNYMATGLTAGTYTVCVTDARGCLSCTSYTLSPTGINEASTQDIDFTVSPNPSNGKFIVQSPVLNRVSVVEIYNMLGEKVFSQQIPANNTSFPVDISGLGKGVYIFTIKTAAQTGLKKVVVY